ncbi:uncharacterized protein [Medicago truncatula]|uniref:uncharacterized protein n=1 Tax=Medicago truncatula TaxID=3880 RepID=UPI000D2F2568|nr:uncharacterized protein LOC25484792 [Medicago truncatula]
MQEQNNATVLRRPPRKPSDNGYIPFPSSAFPTHPPHPLLSTPILAFKYSLNYFHKSHYFHSPFLSIPHFTSFSDPANNEVPQNHKIEVLSKTVYLEFGYNKRKRWSDEENNVLKSFLDAKSWKDINWRDIGNEEKLFGRDTEAIRDKARKLFFKKERQEKGFLESRRKRKGSWQIVIQLTMWCPKIV